jgi:hypothetical protein
MRTIIKSLVVASALVAAGSAFAGQTTESDLNQAQAYTFAAQSAARKAPERVISNDRNTAPVYGTELSRGLNR